MLISQNSSSSALIGINVAHSHIPYTQEQITMFLRFTDIVGKELFKVFGNHPEAEKKIEIQKKINEIERIKTIEGKQEIIMTVKTPKTAQKLSEECTLIQNIQKQNISDRAGLEEDKMICEYWASVDDYDKTNQTFKNTVRNI